LWFHLSCSCSAHIQSSLLFFPFLCSLYGIRRDPLLVLDHRLFQNLFTCNEPEFHAMFPLCLDVCLVFDRLL
jgi:hypothetical protein